MARQRKRMGVRSDDEAAAEASASSFPYFSSLLSPSVQPSTYLWPVVVSRSPPPHPFIVSLVFNPLHLNFLTFWLKSLHPKKKDNNISSSSNSRHSRLTLHRLSFFTKRTGDKQQVVAVLLAVVVVMMVTFIWSFAATLRSAEKMACANDERQGAISLVTALCLSMPLSVCLFLCLNVSG